MKYAARPFPRSRTIVAFAIASVLTPGTFAGSLDADLLQTLRSRGNVDALAASSLQTPATDIPTLLAQSRIAIETGDLERGLVFLNAAADKSSPSDPATLREIACINELLNRDDVAKQAWQRLIATSPAHAEDARLHLAMLELDQKNSEDGNRELSAAQSATAGVVASYFGNADLAAQLFQLGNAKDSNPLLAAAAAFRAKRWAEVETEYEVILHSSADSGDRQFAAGRALEAAKQGGTRAEVVALWRADSALRSEQFLPLAIAWRDMGENAALVSWWRDRAIRPDPNPDLFSARLLAEVADAADAIDTANGASAVLSDAATHDPRGDRSLRTAVRILLRRSDSISADALLRKTLEHIGSDADKLLSLAAIAQAEGRDVIAKEAADRLIALGKESALRGLLIKAKISRREGNVAAATSALEQASTLSRGVATLSLDVAAQFEAAGMDDRVIALLQHVDSHDASTDEDVLVQLAALLANNHRELEAMAVLDHLRRTTKSAGAAAQAGQRMLEIAGIINGYDRLAASLKATLTSGQATEGDVSLLADTYLAMHKSEAAIQLLQTTTILDEKTRRHRLATLLLRTKEYSRAEKVLNEIVATEPDEAVPTLEQIASVAVEQKRADDATKTVAEIAHRAGGGPAADEMMGGIYDRLGWPGEAANRYRRAIASADHADTSEDWLLWSAAILKDGRPEVARNRLLALCIEADTDALFTIAVDALLNFDVAPLQLRAVRREAILRAARRPGDITLAHLVADLSDELSDPIGGRNAREVAAAISSDERPQLLRDLAERAAAEGRTVDAIDYGESFLAIDADFPPQLFLDLGTQLLSARRPSEAARAFRRAIDGPGGDSVAERVAATYERFGRLSDAAAALAPTVAMRPRQLDPLGSLARYREALGQPHESFDLNLRGVTLAIELAKDASASTEELGAIGRLTASAAVTAQSVADYEALVEALRAPMDGFVSANRDASPSVPPFLVALHDALQTATRAGSNYQSLDEIEDRICDHRPRDRAFAQAVLSAQLEDGRFDRAAQFAKIRGLLASLPEGLKTPAATTQPSISTLPRLLADGHRDIVAQFVDSTIAVSVEFADRDYPTLIAAAVTVGDDKAAGRWSGDWIRAVAVRRPADGSGLKAAAAVRERIDHAATAAWAVLPEAQRAAFIDTLITVARSAKLPPSAGHPFLVALKWAADTGIAVDGRAEIIDGLLKSGPEVEPVACRLFELADHDERPALLATSLTRVPPTRRLSLLLQIVDQSIEPFDDGTVQSIVNASNALPSDQTLDGAENWFSNTTQKAVLPTIAEAVLRSAASDALQTRARCAAALSIGGASDRADAIASAMLKQLHAATQTNTDGTAECIRLAIRSLSTNARVGQGAAAAQELAANGTSVDIALFDAAVLDAAGRGSDAIDGLRSLHHRHGENDQVAIALAERLRADGRWAKIIDTFGPTPGRPTPAVVAKTVAQALWALYRSDEAVPSDSIDPSMPVDGTLDSPSFDTALRTLLQRLRASNALFAAVVRVPSEGGLRGVGTDANDVTLAPLSSSIAAQSKWVEALFATARIASPAIRDQLIDTVSDAAAKAPIVRDRLIQLLEDRAATDSFGAVETQISERLATTSGTALPDAVIDRVCVNAQVLGAEQTYAALAAAGRVADAPSLKTCLDVLQRMRSAVVPKTRDREERVLALLKSAVESGDFARVRDGLSNAIAASAWEGKQSLEVSLMLPDTCDSTRATQLMTALATIDFPTAARGVAVTFARLGSWAVHHDASCKPLLDRAQKLAEATADRDDLLAVADLAGESGDTAVQNDLETRLLHESRLPALRIKPLLDRIATALVDASSIAAEAARWCHVPELLAWRTVSRK